jgi:hypothetical protein
VKNIGLNWASLANYGIAAGPFTGDFTRGRGQTLGDGTEVSNTSLNGQTSGTPSTAVTMARPDADVAPGNALGLGRLARRAFQSSRQAWPRYAAIRIYRTRRAGWFMRVTIFPQQNY